MVLGGNALADVLLGKINPSGKLPWTMPKDIDESPAHATHSFPGDTTVTYKEGVLVGYRWFDTKKIAPLYPFGYGLSYTHFNINGLSVNKKTYSKSETILVRCTVKNTGKRYGAEVLQLYVSDPDCSVMRPEKELKAFKKVFLQPGETQVVAMNIKVADLAFYDEKKKLERGTRKICVAAREFIKEYFADNYNRSAVGESGFSRFLRSLGMTALI
ncbi:fibronectin type III-like domain-contianing protein [Niabella sp. W65]|nr:fibronectin type III-like domain-contianing protein [Niabella sp. W65]MCH7364785.1 fibronectin type III-like domain-contianing protein [Niabella sp. W65]ULT40627.1 fibronectin type III-like domain-contianing protein [Niabella sp. I65]